LPHEERRALVVEAPAVGLDVIEPDIVRATRVGLGEDQDGRRHARIRLEYAAGKFDDRVELLVFDEDTAELLVCVRGTEENAVGNDDGRATAGLEQPQEQREEEQLFLVLTTVSKSLATVS